MATKHVSTGTKTTNGTKPTKRKKAAPELADGAEMAVLESGESVNSAGAHIDAETRRQLVAAEAYLIAERRGFQAGRELEDWVAAEAAVDSRLQRRQVA